MFCTVVVFTCFVMCGFVYVFVCNMCVCVCNVWECVCMCGFCNAWVCVCMGLVIRGLLEKYPTFGREKETGLLGALDT